MKTIIAWTAAFVTLATLAFAGVPQTINYQGYLKDGGGVPVSAKTSVVFSLYSSNPARSNPVWQEARGVEPINGIYSIQLGLKNAITAPFDVPYWLGVRVENDPEMALQPLSSAPYALRAATADGMNAGPQTLQTGGAANTGLVVQGAAGQMANLQEWQNSSGSPVASISPGGDLTLTGNLLLPATTASSGAIKSGVDTLIHAFGDRNFFAGIGAGNLGMTGHANTATGYQALVANSAGYSNTAIGYQTLYRNTTAGRNTAIGVGALGSQSYSAGNVVWDSFNTAVGSDALTYNQPTSTSNGAYNTAIGGRSLEYNSIGYNNVGVGYKAGLPELNGYAQTSGYNNTFIGAFSGLGMAVQVNNATAIGYNSRVSTSNSLVLGGIGADAVKVGIGTAAPTESLDVVGNVKISGALSAGSLVAAGSGTTTGVSSASADGVGVKGQSTSSIGVWGTSASGNGVFGENTGATSGMAGVYGRASNTTGTTYGLLGICDSYTSYAVLGTHDSTGNYGYLGSNGAGAYGRNINGNYGMLGSDSAGVRGQGTVGVFAANSTNSAVSASLATTNNAGEFTGDVLVKGNIKREYAAGVSKNSAPIAYGAVGIDGTIYSGTGNFSVVWNAVSSRYEIAINGEAFLIFSYTTIVTPVANAAPRIVTIDSLSSKLNVYIFDLAGSKIQNAFDFVVYKP